jgi:large subunit ribosomal protein L22
MLSNDKFKKVCKKSRVSIEQLAQQLVRGGLNKRQAVAAVKNWQKGMMKPKPLQEDIRRLATALSVDVNDLSQWSSSCRYAPMSASKARLVTALIAGRPVQDAIDVLKFTRKRASEVVTKVLKTAIADADEQQANVEKLYVDTARVDDAGIRIGTKRWIAKDRGKAYPLRKKACHIHVIVTEA